MIVSYRPIEEFPGYRVGDDGSVWKWFKGGSGNNGGRLPRWKRLKGTLNNTGQFMVHLRKDGKSHIKSVGSLVLKAFVGPRPLGFVVYNFPDRDPRNCSLANLRWAPRGTGQIGNPTNFIARGECHASSTITDEEVERVRSLYASGEFNMSEIAELMVISRVHVGNILKGRWRCKPSGVIRPSRST